MRATRAKSSLVGLVTLAMLVVAMTASAANSADPVRANVERARNGAGLRVGAWNVQDVPNGVGTSQTPAFEGYFQKGIDLHLVWENTIGYWSHTYTTSQGGLLGSSTDKIQTHLVPSMTALKIYPLTNRASQVEPF